MIVFDKDSVNAMMLDAKFIPKWQYASVNDDFSKVANDFNKCVRDMVCLDMHKTGVVFPCQTESLFKKYKINSAGDMFYVMGINVPPEKQKDTFYSWNDSFEKDIKQQIGQYLIPAFNAVVSS